MGKLTLSEPSTMPGQYNFQKLWLIKDIYKDWLVKDLQDIHMTRCRAYSKSRKVLAMCVTVINLNPCLKLCRVKSLTLRELVLEKSMTLMLKKVWEPWEYVQLLLVSARVDTHVSVRYAFQGYRCGRCGKYIQVYCHVLEKLYTQAQRVHTHTNTHTLHLSLTMWDPHPVCFIQGGSTVSSGDYRCKPQPVVNCLRVEMHLLALCL